MLFAEEVRPPQEVVQSVNFWLTIGLLMAILLGGAVVLSLVERWRKRQAEPAREGIGGLSLYRQMYDDGELDEEEYRVIRDRFAKRLKGKPAGPELTPGLTPGLTPELTPELTAGVGEAVRVNLAGSPEPPPESPEKAPPIS